MDYRENVLIKVYLKDEKKKITLNSIISIYENKFNNKINYDCYVDTISNLLLIKFYSEKLEYIPIDINIDPNIINNNFERIKYSWTNYILNNFSYEKESKLKLIWNNNHLNLPENPILIDNVSINEDQNPIIGSCVKSLNKLIGIVSYLTEYKIIITPIICIQKFIDYIYYDNNLFYLGIDLFPIKLNFSSELNKINYDYGIMIGNNFYDIKNKKNEKSTEKLTSNEFQIDLNIDFNLNLNSNSNSNSNYESNLKFLSRKNIICLVDNYKINSDGNLEINSLYSIPLKSYIWIFKNSKNNILNINLIQNNAINFDILEFKYNPIVIDDSYVKKKINIISTQIFLDKNYNDISGLSLCELKYIKYRNKYILELNEKILKILKPLAINNRIYYKIFNKIISQRYDKNSNKIILGIRINENNIPTIKNIAGYKNFQNIIDTLNDSFKIKNFIDKNI
jgi:hypothetical protein